MTVQDKRKQEEERRKRNAEVAKRFCLPTKNRTVPLPPDVGISWLKIEPSKSIEVQKKEDPKND